ncbi:hypothetical protein EIP86_007542 [Pleurotus ostreatoroseus]|nr:hypothetical protein EIP86_007542 [Pleurotus ostreatoroseus]
MLKTYDDIDRELSTLSEKTRRLRRERNALTPTCRLPPEVLSMIFVSVTDAEPLAEPQDFTAPRIKNWYPILHVCKRWRAVALECPTLWNRIDVTSPLWAQEMLRLSKKAPLILKAEGYSMHSRMTETCKSVMAESERLSTLHLSGFRECLFALCLGLKQAPNLRSLVLRHCHWLADVNALELPESFLENGAPRLERLELQKCAMSWDAPLFTSSPNVTRLMVQGVDKARPTYAQLLRTLSNMSSLEHLHLDNVLPTPDPGLVDVSPIHLALRTLYLSGTTSELASFFRYFSIPPTVSASITCRQPTRLEDITDLLSTFVQSRKGSHGTPSETLRSWSLSFTPNSFFLAGSVDGATSRISPYNGNPSPIENSLALTINMSSKGSSFLWSVIQSLLHNLPIALTATTSLIVNDDGNFMECYRWQYLMQHMPNISTLRTYRFAAMNLFTTLDPTKPVKDNKDDSYSSTPLFPRLELLDLHNVNLGWTVQPGSIPLLQSLQDTQITRSNAADPMPIDTLHISGCLNVGQQEVKTLCHLFTVLEWDGFEVYVPTPHYVEPPGSLEREGEWILSFGWDDWHTL